MIKKRIIPVLLLKDQRMVKGKQFGNFRDTGHPVYTAKVYDSQKVDELVFLDIRPERDSIDHLLRIVREVSEECFVPLTVGGGIRTLEHARSLIEGGADKISLNSVLFENPSLIKGISDHFGSQAVVVSLDVRKIGNSYVLFSHSGSVDTGKDPVEMAREAEALGAGELIVTSIDHEGMMSGYDLEIIDRIMQVVSIPVIANGGVGKLDHFSDAFKLLPKLSAVAASSIFHFTDQSPIKVRSYLLNQNIAVREI